MTTAADPAPRLLRRRLAIASLCAASLAAASATLSDPTTGEHTAPAVESADSDLADTARFLAGKGAARTPSYTEYAAQLSARWRQFQQPNLERMRSWWADHGPKRYATVFYPFSGPDIGNALAFFPDADAYLLFGLEAPGAMPDLRGLDDSTLSAGLHDLEASLGTILQVNYFFTRAMEKKLGNGAFNSVSGLLLFFLAMSDCVVTGAREVAIDDGGALVQRTAAARVPGVELTFRRPGSTQEQTIRYFKVNVADASLAKSSPGFLPYLERQGRFATMIKSASYLMHERPARFARIRSLILDRSDFIVQDDSGVPLGLFPRDAWKLRFHGTYEAPTPEFARHLQKDLRIEMHRNSTGKLPFSYGYAFKQGESNLMTAERAQ